MSSLSPRQFAKFDVHTTDYGYPHTAFNHNDEDVTAITGRNSLDHASSMGHIYHSRILNGMHGPHEDLAVNRRVGLAAATGAYPEFKPKTGSYPLIDHN